ncbi:MAG TPA: hypothetical protein VMU14_19160 [Acidimicrobiales bacterium]|nr:hypothetical protein [Acidimicrobiales bacterium]
MHPFLAEAMTDVRRRDLEAQLRRRSAAPPRRGRARSRARVAVGVRLINLGLRLVDLPANLPLGHDPA